MSPPVQISPQARDINFDFNNSCNCCWFKKRPNPNTPVYVNSNGDAAPFTTTNHDRRKAIHRCISNIQLHVSQVAQSHQTTIPNDLESIRKLTGAQLSLDKPPTLQDIIKINEAMKTIFEKENDG